MLFVLSISYNKSLTLDFTVFISGQQYSFSVKDYFLSAEPSLLQSSYFVIGGNRTNFGIIHSLNIFTTTQDPLFLSQYSLLSLFYTNQNSFFLLNVRFT